MFEEIPVIEALVAMAIDWAVNKKGFSLSGNKTGTSASSAAAANNTEAPSCKTLSEFNW